MADLMIGIMKAELCNAGGTPASIGSLKSGSLTLKPQYKEHKSGFPQITDIKVPEVITGTFKFDCEEIGLIRPLAHAGVSALASGVPHNVDVACEAPTAQGSAFTMDGSGYIKSVTGQATANDFSSMTVEVDCVPMGAVGDPLITFGNAAPGGNSTIAAPNYTHQQLTTDSDNLAFGTPLVAKGVGAFANCRMFNFSATGNFKYHTAGFPPVIDLAIMESNEFTLSAEFEDPTAALLTDALSAFTPGNQPVKDVTVNAKYIIIGGTDVVVTLKHAMVEPDLTFNPGNDWNGVTVKCTALLPVGTPITSGWAMTIL
jgi:hypothetical protein